VTAAGGPPVDRGVPRRIAGFHTDDEGHWVADLECGHTRHVRHDPPWQVRPWVLSAEGRARFIGVRLGCVRCLEAGGEGPIGPATGKREETT
jgi:hypothetical protein